uniref:Uncharacterized protein n=1 Tax=Anguilla anguilla TaxID=7936 RepID=A0A0E9RTS1_ANGAN
MLRERERQAETFRERYCSH